MPTTTMTTTQRDPKTSPKIDPEMALPSLDTYTMITYAPQIPNQPYSHVALNPLESVETITLHDWNSTGKERPWKKWKLAAERAGNALQSWDKFPQMVRHGERILDCGTWLEFGTCPDGDGKWLTQANFCNVRSCPLCMWRRSKKMTAQVLDVSHAIQAKQDVRWLLLTLTAQNIEAGFSSAPDDRPEIIADKLGEGMNVLTQGFSRLTKQRFWDSSILGFYRTLEITRNLDEEAWRGGSRWYGSYNPHMHVLIPVLPSYFTRNYIKQAEWTERWKQAAKLDYQPIVDIRPLRPKGKPDADPRKLNNQEILSGVLEVGKYLTKPNFLAPDKLDPIAEQTQRTLALATHKRRLTGWGGMMLRTKKELKLEDAEGNDADLVHVAGNTDPGCQCRVCGSDLVEEVFRWHIGHKNYERR